MKSRVIHQEGSSLIEVLITLLIIGVIAVFYDAALRSNMVTRNAKAKDLALRIATHQMEGLRAGGYAALPASGPFSDSLLSDLPSGSATMSISDYNAKTKQVSLTVSWIEPAGGTHAVSLATLITQVGGLK